MVTLGKLIRNGWMNASNPVITYSKLAIETLEQGMKYVQS